MGIQFPTWSIKDLNIMVAVQHTDTVSVDVGCSYCPVAVDVAGVIRLSNALSMVEERLRNIIASGTSDEKAVPAVPDHMRWIVTVWHFGADALITYFGKIFNTRWEVAQHALVTAYSKEWEDGKYRVRIEKQEYPKKTFADAVEEKLNEVHKEANSRD